MSTKITKGTYGHGSYGYSSNPPGTTMTLWHCGVHVFAGKLYHRNPTSHIGNDSTPCMHRSRALAAACVNRAELNRLGDGIAAKNLRGTIVIPHSSDCAHWVNEPCDCSIAKETR